MLRLLDQSVSLNLANIISRQARSDCSYFVKKNSVKADLLLSYIGSETTGFKAKVKAPFSLPSRKTWKASLTQLRSMF